MDAILFHNFIILFLNHLQIIRLFLLLDARF